MAQINVLPASKIPISTASKLPVIIDSSTHEPFSIKDIGPHSLGSSSLNSETLSSFAQLDQLLTKSKNKAVLVAQDGAFVYEGYGFGFDPEALESAPINSKKNTVRLPSATGQMLRVTKLD